MDRLPSRLAMFGFVAFAVTAFALLATPAVAAAGDPAPLTATLEVSPSTSAQLPFRLDLRVTNTGSGSCQVSPSPASAVITRVSRGSDIVTPALDIATVDGGLAIAADSRADLAPGASIRIPIRVDPSGLESLSPMPDDTTTAVAQTWALGAGGDLQVTVALAPAAVDGCAAPAPASVTIQAPGSGSVPVAAAVIVLALLAAIALVVWLLRRRRVARALVLVVALAAGPALAPRPVEAVILDQLKDYAADGAGCFALFRAPGGDPAGILATAEASPHTITILDDYSGFLQSTAVGTKRARTLGVGDNPTIFWSPTDLEREGDVPGDPCATLYHLLAHAADTATGAVDLTKCPGGLTVEEVRAVMAENAYRLRYNLPLLTTDRGKPIPLALSDCGPAAKSKLTRKKKFVLTCGTRPCGSLGGDPHYRTYDAVRFDFQSVGEFVLTRSDDGAFEIQARQAAVPAWRSVSVATMIAARIGSSRAVVSLGAGSLLSGGGLTVGVDGAAVTGTGAQPVGDGGSVELTPAGDQVVLRWADGSVALASVIPGQGIDVEVKPAAVLQGHLVGLLGDDNGDQSNDFRLGDGTTLGSPPAFDDVHGRFADSWRVTDTTSLFDYAPGTSTATFTDRTVPGSSGAADIAAELPAAHDLCIDLGADPADAADLANCAYDLAATGNASFASAAIDDSLPPAADAIELGDAEGGNSGGPSPTPGSRGATVDRGPMASGDTVSGTLGSPTERDLYELHADAGAIAFLTAGGDCSPLSGGGSPAWYLARASAPDVPISGTLPFCVDLGRFAFPEAGDYVLVLDANGYTVPYSFTWADVATSSDAPVALDTDVSGSIATAGQRNTYLFTTPDTDLDIEIVSPLSCDAGFVWKVAQGDSTASVGTLCGTSPRVHLGGGGTWQIVISAPDVTGSYSFRIRRAQP
jgi:hypothetical protein